MKLENPGVASTSRIKIESVEKALGIKAVEGYKSESEINEQPIGYQEIRRGALNRIKNATILIKAIYRHYYNIHQLLILRTNYIRLLF